MGILIRVHQEKQPLERIEVTRYRALEIFSENKFKVEIMKELPKDKKIIVCRCGPLVDLCRVPHIPNTTHVKAFPCQGYSQLSMEDAAVVSVGLRGCFSSLANIFTSIDFSCDSSFWPENASGFVERPVHDLIGVSVYTTLIIYSSHSLWTWRQRCDDKAPWPKEWLPKDLPEARVDHILRLEA